MKKKRVHAKVHGLFQHRTKSEGDFLLCFFSIKFSLLLLLGDCVKKATSLTLPKLHEFSPLVISKLPGQGLNPSLGMGL